MITNFQQAASARDVAITRDCRNDADGRPWRCLLFAAPAHYFVISGAADGTLSVVSHQYVNLDAGADALTPDALG